MIHEKQILKYLSIVRNLKTECKFYDMHVHPFEIIYNSFVYDQNPVDHDLYSLGNAEYSKPKINELNLGCEHAKSKDETPKSKLSNLIGLRSVYGHIGPKIIEENMELGGIDEVLLLPVAQSSEPIDSQMNYMSDIFGHNPKFHFSGSVPNSTPDSKISQFIEENIKKYKIKAIKIHPNITEINMQTTAGKERVDCILDSCRQFKLPLIIHGGRSPILENKEASEYGHIKNFESIDWHTSSESIVIAHAGGYGCDRKEIEQDVLPKIKKLLHRYSNLMIDISGLNYESLVMILKQIDIKRILFGSDALYYRQWAALVRTMHALKNSKRNMEENLIQLASINPSRHIFDRVENNLAKIASR